MSPEDDFEEAYRTATAQAGDVAGAASGDAYVADVQAALDDGLRVLREVAAEHGNQQLHYLKGFMAEGWHAATFNIDAARQRLASHFHATLPKATTLNSPDVRVESALGTHDFQLKFFKTAEESGKALSAPGYASVGKVAPADQVADLKEAVLERAARIAEHRPEQAGHLADTARRVSGRVEVGDVASRPLDHDAAKALARSARDGTLDAESANLTLERTLQDSDVAREAAIGAGTAAAISAVIGAAPHVARAVRAWLDDKPPAEQWAHLQGAVRDGGKGLAVGGLRGGVAAGLVIAARAGALGEAAKSLTPGAIGALTALVLQGAADAIDLKNGVITKSEFALRFSRNAAAAGAGTVGAGIGQALIPIPLLGAVIGSVVGSALATVVHGGGVAGLRRLENREAWEEQVEVARALTRLASQLEVAAEGTALLVRVSEAEAVRFESATAHWERAAARTDASLERAARAHGDVRRRLTEGALGRVLLAAEASRAKERGTT